MNINFFMKNGSVFVIDLIDECEAIQLVKEPNVKDPKGLLINKDSFISGMAAIKEDVVSDNEDSGDIYIDGYRVSHIEPSADDDYYLVHFDEEPAIPKHVQELNDFNSGWRRLLVKSYEEKVADGV